MRLEPEQTSFEIMAQESILDAALRAGIPLDYNCSNGACGRCRVRVLDGEVEQLRHADYAFTAADKDRHYVLGCSMTARSDLSIEASVAHSSRDIQPQRLTARIRRREIVDRDVMVLHLRTPRNQRLRFLAGQYVSLQMPGMPPYDAAVASCPCEDMRLELHVRRTPSDAFSNYLFDTARSGQAVEVSGPQGDFVLHEPSDRPLLLIAFDTGFAAIKSLIEHSLALNDERVIYLYWLNCRDEQPYMHNWCRSMQDAIDQFHYRWLGLQQVDCTSDTGGADRVLALVRRCMTSILDEIPDLGAYEAYVAAPRIVKWTAREMLGSRGLDESSILIEPVHGNKDVSCLVE